MRNDFRLNAIIEANQEADYDKVHKEFMEHFPLFWKLGPVNYAGLVRVTGLNWGVEEIVAVYLCGLAYERVTTLGENMAAGHGIDIYNPVYIWDLIKGEVEYLKPDPAPAPARGDKDAPAKSTKK